MSTQSTSSLVTSGLYGHCQTRVSSFLMAHQFKIGQTAPLVDVWQAVRQYIPSTICVFHERLYVRSCIRSTLLVMPCSSVMGFPESYTQPLTLCWCGC